jgi:LppP/LprE lipoprotein
MQTLAGALALLLAGCGGAARTVSVSGAPPAGASTSAPPSTTSAPPSTTSEPAPSGTATTTPSTTSSGSASPQSTRTAPEPKFVEEKRESSAAGLSGALATLRAHGYGAVDPSEYHPDQTLSVLVGTRANGGSAQQAFFFIDGRYLGTDASTPSGQIAVVSQSDTEVTLAYSLYRSSDPICCPGGGRAQVRFQLNNGRLTALDPIPATEPATGDGRR